MDPLGNPVWHALAGPQRTVAEGSARALRFAPDIAPFAALPDDVEPADWEALRVLAGPGGVAVLGRPHVGAPVDLPRVFDIPGVQMVADRSVPDVARPTFRVLGDADADAMAELVARTQPGPWRTRTYTLGTYIGVHDGDRLVAMAGERMRPPGYTEISAVCTDPEYRGRGLAAGLVAELMDRIRARGEIPMLHAAAGNKTAVRLYEMLGFELRRAVEFIGVQFP
ncbi:MAG TPA: GNAT family N-acetyltransferase [Acidimicrobiia bacterium]|nr:GNAT family N-acetyltransferase [Acidimicrobiia bacterium]